MRERIVSASDKGSDMITRRSLLAALPAISALPALSQADWRQTIKEIRFGVSSAENEAAALARTSR